MTHLLTYSLTDNLKARDASASKNKGQQTENAACLALGGWELPKGKTKH